MEGKQVPDSAAETLEDPSHSATQLLPVPRRPDSGRRVFFQVWADSIFTQIDTPIPFNITESNVGGGWNEEEFRFYAPLSGAYLFTSLLRGGIPTEIRGGKYMLNGDKRLSFMSLYETSGTTIMDLQRDDEVHIELGNQLGIDCASREFRCVFAGFLLE